VQTPTASGLQPAGSGGDGESSGPDTTSSGGPEDLQIATRDTPIYDPTSEKALYMPLKSGTAGQGSAERQATRPEVSEVEALDASSPTTSDGEGEPISGDQKVERTDLDVQSGSLEPGSVGAGLTPEESGVDEIVAHINVESYPTEMAATSTHDEVLSGGDTDGEMGLRVDSQAGTSTEEKAEDMLVEVRPEEATSPDSADANGGPESGTKATKLDLGEEGGFERAMVPEEDFDIERDNNDSVLEGTARHSGEHEGTRIALSTIAQDTRDLQQKDKAANQTYAYLTHNPGIRGSWVRLI